MVVGEQDADHARASIVTVVPSPGADVTASVPPASRARASSSVEPDVARLAAPLAPLGVEAAAVVGDRQQARRDGDA